MHCIFTTVLFLCILRIWRLRTSMTDLTLSLETVFPQKSVLLVGNCPHCIPENGAEIIDNFPGTVVRFNDIHLHGARPADVKFVYLDNGKTVRDVEKLPGQIVLSSEWMTLRSPLRIRNKLTRNPRMTSGYTMIRILLRHGYDVHVIGFSPGSGSNHTSDGKEWYWAHDLDFEKKVIDQLSLNGAITRYIKKSF